MKSEPIYQRFDYQDPEYKVIPDLVKDELNLQFQDPKTKLTRVSLTFRDPGGIMEMIALLYEGIEATWPEFVAWMAEEQRKAQDDSQPPGA
jgi:hypothetical protein